jgi:iron complex transport system permease protein
VRRSLEPALAVALAGLVLAALVVGPGDVDLGTALSVVARGGADATDGSPTVTALVWDLRLPRALCAATVGAALGVAGVVTQGLLRNPLAEPGVLGISTGAATLAVLGFSLGLDALGLWVTPALAALGAALSFAVLLALCANASRASTLLLTGVALAAMGGAFTTLLLALDTERWDLGIKIVRWLMGSFEGRSWLHLWAAVIPIGVGLLVATWLRVDLDALALGEDTAHSLGVRLDRTRRVALAAVAILVGCATALCGVIGFVGLVVPHILRLIIGAGHRRLVPTSALAGAVTLLLVDVASRAATSVVIPPGVVTALVGGPVLVWLLRRQEEVWS